MNTPVFHVTQLIQHYNGVQVLDIPELTIAPKTIYCVYGPNGSGKTTLFEMLTRLREPERGHVWFQGKQVFPGDEGLGELRAHVTIVHQDPLLFDTSVERNVDYGLRIRKVAKFQRVQRVQECLQLVGLDGFQKRKARQLSGGETQRVAIARALAIHPDVLFLDEFSANVDDRHRALLETIIHNIRERFGTTVVFTTHYLEQAYRVADEVIHLFQGRVMRSPLKNIFHGTLQRKNDLCRFSTYAVSFDVIASHEGHATVAIPPASIVLSLRPIESSMRNHFQGTITHIIDAGNHIDLKVQAGEVFEVTLTKESYHELQIHPGMSIFLNFKVTAVEVF